MTAVAPSPTAVPAPVAAGRRPTAGPPDDTTFAAIVAALVPLLAGYQAPAVGPVDGSGVAGTTGGHPGPAGGPVGGPGLAGPTGGHGSGVPSGIDGLTPGIVPPATVPAGAASAVPPLTEPAGVMAGAVAAAVDIAASDIAAANVAPAAGLPAGPVTLSGMVAAGVIPGTAEAKVATSQEQTGKEGDVPADPEAPRASTVPAGPEASPASTVPAPSAGRGPETGNPAVAASGTVTAPTAEPPDAGVSAPGADPAPTPPHHQVVSVVARLRQRPDGAYRLGLQLHPEHLGRVQVDVELRNGELHLHLRADSPLAADTLRHGLPELRAELEAAGFRAGSLDVAGGDGRGFAGEHPTPQAARHESSPSTAEASIPLPTDPSPGPDSGPGSLDIRL